MAIGRIPERRPTCRDYLGCEPFWNWSCVCASTVPLSSTYMTRRQALSLICSRLVRGDSESQQVMECLAGLVAGRTWAHFWKKTQILLWPSEATT